MSAREKIVPIDRRDLDAFAREENSPNARTVPVWVVALGVIIYCCLAWALIAQAGQLIFGIFTGAYVRG